MEHGEAVQQKATRYLLNELSPEARDAFEGHFFDCRECALDLRAAAAFVDEAKAQLPGLQTQARPAVKKIAPQVVRVGQPALYTSLCCAGFRSAGAGCWLSKCRDVARPAAVATQPHLVTLAELHTGVRGGDAAVIVASRKQGASISIALPCPAGVNSLKPVLLDPAGKQWWTATVAAPNENDDRQLGLDLPGDGLTAGKYTLVISGVDAKNTTTEISRTAFEIQLPQ